MRWAIVGSAALVVVGLAAFWWASSVARRTPASVAPNAITVTIRGNVCDPNEITVPAGRTTFTIVNESQRALEWEILDGVMVVEERENIAPGFSQTLTARLTPGEFDITCGLLSSPRGKLRVTPSAVSDSEAARPSLVAYVGPLAEYRVYLALEAGTLEDTARALLESIQRGQLAQARLDYVSAHQAYKRIEPMADLFADLDTRLNARAEYFEKREADPRFTGFHRLEYALFADSTRAADPKLLSPIAEGLLTDITALQERLRALNIAPERLTGASARRLSRIAENLVGGGEERYSHTEVSGLQGTLEGAKKIGDLLAPLLEKAAPALNLSIAKRFDTLAAALEPYRVDAGFRTEPLDETQRRPLADHIRALADDFGKVNAALGLE